MARSRLKELVRTYLSKDKEKLAAAMYHPMRIVANYHHAHGDPEKALFHGWECIRELLEEEPDLFSDVEELIGMVDFPDNSPFPQYLFVKGAKPEDNARLLAERSP